MKNLKMTKLFVLACVVLFMHACTQTVAKPISANPNYRVYNFSRLVVLPILDARKDKKIKYDFNKKLENTIKRQLVKSKKYEIKFSNHYGKLAAINPDDLKGADSEWMKSLGINNGRYVFLMVVQDLQSRLTFGSVGSAELAGYLYDTENGQLIWYNKGVGKAGQGGLLGMAMKGMMAMSALRSAVYQMLRAFPPKGQAPAFAAGGK